METFEKAYQPLIKDIFIDKYSSVVSLHAYDIGSVSDSQGFYHICLKPNETLLKFYKVYYLAQEEKHSI